MTTPSFIRGRIDTKKRPLAMLEWRNGVRALAIIDTAFDGYLFLGDTLAGELNFEPTTIFRPVSYASGNGEIELSHGEVFWKGQWIRISAHVVDDSERTHATTEPAVLIGTRLLFPDVLTVDFLEEWWKVESK